MKNPLSSRTFFVIPTIGGIYILLLLSSCSRSRLLRKLATDTVTVRQMVTVTVPRDSAVLRLVTDTTTVIREIRQGRATVRIVREPHFTTVYATCDSVRISKEAIAKVPRNTIIVGVNRWYKTGFWVAFLLFGILSAAIWLSRTWAINVTRKQ